MEALFKASISCVLVINKNLIFLHMELHHFKFTFYLQCRMKATERSDHFAGASFYHNFYRVICI